MYLNFYKKDYKKVKLGVLIYFIPCTTVVLWVYPKNVWRVRALEAHAKHWSVNLKSRELFSPSQFPSVFNTRVHVISFTKSAILHRNGQER